MTVIPPPTENFNCIGNIGVKSTVWIPYYEIQSNEVLPV